MKCDYQTQKCDVSCEQWDECEDRQKKSTVQSPVVLIVCAMLVALGILTQALEMSLLRAVCWIAFISIVCHIIMRCTMYLEYKRSYPKFEVDNEDDESALRGE
jgi:hypothetical protein